VHIADSGRIKSKIETKAYLQEQQHHRQEVVLDNSFHHWTVMGHLAIQVALLDHPYQEVVLDNVILQTMILLIEILIHLLQ